MSNVWNTSTSTLTNCCWDKVTVWGNWDYSIGPEKKPHSLTIQQGTKVTTLLLLFHHCAQLLSASVPRHTDSLNKWGLPNQPNQSRRQPTRDLTKLGFADDLALVAGLEDVSRTCCPTSSWTRRSSIYSEIRCIALCVLQLLGFSVSGPLRKHMFTCKSFKGHGLWFVIGRFWSVLFLWCFKVHCFVIILFREIIDLLSLLRRFFSSFLSLSLARIKQRLLPSFDKKSTHRRDFLCYSWAV